MICSFSELRDKEVINLYTGLKIGYVDDLEFDSVTGEILSLIVYGRPRALGLMGRDEDITIRCRDIHLIGEDIILVKLNDSAKCIKKEKIRVENLLK
ncbi:MAG: YlmC/YmxH family sporulation protein [Oscillospiraceae bacterium]